MRTLIHCAAAMALLVACDGGTGPVIDELDPPAATRGSPVEIRGDRFCGDEPDAADEQGICADGPDGVVELGEDDPIRAPIQLWRDQRIAITVPEQAPSGPTTIVVRVGGVPSAPAELEVLD